MRIYSFINPKNGEQAFSIESMAHLTAITESDNRICLDGRENNGFNPSTIFTSKYKWSMGDIRIVVSLDWEGRSYQDIFKSNPKLLY